MTTSTENVVHGKWKEIKGDIQKMWGRLTDSELEQTKGEMQAVNGLLQQKYGDAYDKSSKDLSDIYKKFESKSE